MSLGISTVGISTVSSAQTIIDASRRIDWSQAGINGGIPHRTTICTTLHPGATAAQINSAIAACANGVVYLTAGTYTLAGGIDFAGRSNVTLRGAGPDQTFLVFTGSVSCFGLGADVCVRNTDLSYSQGPAHTANWTAGYAPGTTTITLSSTSGLQVGSLLILDQLNDATDTGGVFVCSTLNVCADEGPGGAGRSAREQSQIARVTAISGTTVTIAPGLYMPNWRASQSPVRGGGPPRSRWMGSESDARSHQEPGAIGSAFLHGVSVLGGEREVGERRPEPRLALSDRAHGGARQLFLRHQERGLAELRRGIVHELRQSGREQHLPARDRAADPEWVSLRVGLRL
jgi:hypothetical protein